MTCIVTAIIKDAAGAAIQGAKLICWNSIAYYANEAFVMPWEKSALSDALGNVSLPLVETTTIAKLMKWRIEYPVTSPGGGITTVTYNFKDAAVPNQATAKINSFLIPA